MLYALVQKARADLAALVPRQGLPARVQRPVKAAKAAMLRVLKVVKDLRAGRDRAGFLISRTLRRCWIGGGWTTTRSCVGSRGSDFPQLDPVRVELPGRSQTVHAPSWQFNLFCQEMTDGPERGPDPWRAEVLLRQEPL